MYSSATDAWLNLLDDILERGQTHSPRGKTTKELLGYQIHVDMARPVLNIKDRTLGFKFLAAEANWILRGENRVSTIAPYAAHISSFSDDGVFFAGAYGPRVVDQLMYIVDTLATDQESRQAVLTIWRPNPRPSKDIPCTVACQWLIRPHYRSGDPALYCIDTMRSSDAWLGVPYDVFNFSQLSLRIALLLRRRGVNVRLGGLTLQAGSQHLYEKDWKSASRIANGPEPDREFYSCPRILAESFEDVAEHENFLMLASGVGKGAFAKYAIGGAA